MKIINIIKNNKSILSEALSTAMVLKIATDSANAGGVTMEIEVERRMNDMFQSKNLPYVCVSNKGLLRIAQRDDFTLDFSLVGAEDLKQLKSKIETSDNIASSADLFLFEVKEQTLKLVDSVSFKTSTSDSSAQIYLHNDADGSIYDSFVAKNYVNIGQVVLFNFYPETSACDVYYFDGSMKSFYDLFSVAEEDSGKTTMHGKNLIDKKGVTTVDGKGRNIVSMINRAKAKKKKDGEDKKSTSFNRGITISRKSLPFLAKKGVLEVACSFEIPFSSIEEDDFLSRYPQLIKGETHDNAA